MVSFEWEAAIHTTHTLPLLDRDKIGTGFLPELWRARRRRDDKKKDELHTP